MKREIIFATEADLCTAFSDWAKKQGWIPYAETEGWDILLVGTDDTQIGIQAKLTFNMKVLHQTVEDTWMAWHETGPDYRAVLTPCGDASICHSLGVVNFHAAAHDPKRFMPVLDKGCFSDPWHYWNPTRRYVLPEYVPDVAAGASAPIQLTKWKIGALKIAAILELRGFVTRADFKNVGIDMRRWVGPGGWLEPGTRGGEFIAGELNFQTLHQTVYPKIRADIATEIAAGRI